MSCRRYQLGAAQKERQVQQTACEKEVPMKLEYKAMEQRMKYKCPACPKEFQSKRDLKRHCIKYHGVELEDMNEHYFMTRRTIRNLLGNKKE